MGPADIIILSLIGIVFFLIIFSRIRKSRLAKKNGTAAGGCSGNCAGCAHSGSHRKEK